jgi:Integrase core domain
LASTIGSTLMQPLLGGLDPGLESVALHLFGFTFTNNYPCCLHKHDTQIAIAALWPKMVQSSVETCLDEPKPCGEVTPPGEAIASPDRVDQGSEFVSCDLDLWAYQCGVTRDFSRPGKPTDNAFIESFNGKFRAEC